MNDIYQSGVFEYVALMSTHCYGIQKREKIMGYVNKNLMSGEDVIYNAKIHWFIFVPGISFFTLGIILFVSQSQQEFGPVIGIFALLAGLFLLLKAIITKISTELSVTSKRIIAKVGLIRRNTAELNHSKVESFNIDQSIFGRIFGFGTLIINGTGGGNTPIPNIDSPLEFRRKAVEAIDASQS
jgi:uncharacterized membrane protein YdbT with pleckstrin-like domain